ncbi:MAG TPA: M23 family metallopeptidase, partial [Bacteroidia bacterium]|nr:M23 family metallopeptidase [Bacteroidia bacterium]
HPKRTTLSVHIRHVSRALAIFVALFPCILFAGNGDTLALSPRAAAIASSIDEMSEPELVLLMDSLIDADVREAPLYALIHRKIDEIHASIPKNNFDDGFQFYPGNRFYGIWDTQHLFPYPDSLFKCDTVTDLNLAPEISGEFFFPIIGPITSPFGWRDTAYHRGIDIDLNRGDSVRSAFSGMVRLAAKEGGYGNVVIVRHYNGLETVYAHLWKIKVKPGDIVTSGQLLGLGGSTGHSTGTHLHFETRFRGVAINPAWIIDLKTHRLFTDKISLVRTRQGYAVRPTLEDFHTVVRGDNLYTIAQHYGISVKQLRAWNGWNGPVHLKAGQQVRIKQPAEVTSSTF